MKYVLVIVFLLGLMCYSITAKADVVTSSDPNLEHFAAHFGISYMLNTFSYGVCRKALGLTQKDSFIFSAFTTLAIGFTFKYLEVMNGGNTSSWGSSMLQNAAGVGASIGTMYIFKF